MSNKVHYNHLHGVLLRKASKICTSNFTINLFGLYTFYLKKKKIITKIITGLKYNYFQSLITANIVFCYYLFLCAQFNFIRESCLPNIELERQ